MNAFLGDRLFLIGLAIRLVLLTLVTPLAHFAGVIGPGTVLPGSAFGAPILALGWLGQSAGANVGQATIGVG